ncbi:MAG: fibronectin type III domain-containing protein [Anaerovoracaceae bacterium]
MIEIKKTASLFIAFILVLICSLTIQTTSAYGVTSDSAFESYMTQQGFPESYKDSLRVLHQTHPNWVFTGLKTGVDWNTALTAEADPNVSLIHINQPDSCKSVAKGDYNFDGKYYIGKDSSAWVSASKEAVGYYLDPRNFLTEKSVFMFEDLSYHPEYQTEQVVKKILSGTKMPDVSSAYFMKAAQQIYNGKTYSVSPTHLAARVRQEIGNTTFVISGEPFNYGGFTYMGLYNPYNIGATSGSDAAKKGLIYANGGKNGTILSKTYNRPWNTLESAVMGGALVICDGYITNNQNTNYLEKFNVANGVSNVGTHQYMTNIMAPSTEAITVYDNYNAYGILDENLTFLIPIFDNMPTMPSQKPMATGNNNCFLDTLSVDGYVFTTPFDRCSTNYQVQAVVDGNISSVNISAKGSSDDAVIVGAGNVSLRKGNNVFNVKVTSSTGKNMTYTINIIKGEGTTTEKPQNPTDLVTSLVGPSTVKLSWTGDSNADGYRIRYKKVNQTKWFFTETDKTTFEKKMATEGAKYQFKIRAFYKDGEKKIYSPDYSDISEEVTFGTTPIITGDLYKGYLTARISWDEVKGATGYRVRYKRTSSERWLYKDVEKPEFIQKLKKAGIEYDFRIRPYAIIDDVKYYSFGYSDIISFYTIKAPTVVLEERENSSVFVNWDNIRGETGYKVYRSTSETGKYSMVKTITRRYSSWLDENKKPGNTYYYKVRAYKVVGDKTIYGPASKVQGIIL